MRVVRFVFRRCAQKALWTMGMVGASLLVLGTAAVAAGFGAHLTGNTTTFSSATMQLEGTTSGVNCFSTGTGSGGSVNSNSTACPSPVAGGSLSNLGAGTAASTLTSVGNVNASAATVSSPTCGVAELVDTGANVQWSGSGTNTALVFNGVTYQTAGPMTGGQGITTDGSTGWAETTASYVNPETFTVLIWFKTTSPSGALLGFGTQSNPVTSTPASHDRQLWVDSSGKLVWGIYNGGLDQVTSSSTVDGGGWEFAAVTIGSLGQLMYVNGVSVGTGTTTNTLAQSFTGWWSLGYASLAGWNDIPANYYFNGSIAQVAVIPSQLTATQISTLYTDRSTLATYASAVNAFNPVDNWGLSDSGTVPYLGSVPGATASTTLADASGNGNTGSAQGGVTLAAAGPTTLGGDAVSLNGSSGYVQTNNSYSNPEGFSAVAWFKATGTSGGTVLGFTSSQTNATPGSWDRALWLDNTGKLVWGVYPGSVQEITSASAYNNGSWHMVVAEIGSSGQQLWVDGTRVAFNASVTTAQSYTGYWHLGWGYEGGSFTDAPTSSYLNGSLAQVAIVPAQLSASNISNLYTDTSVGDFVVDMGALTPTAYWPLGDSSSNVCGTTEFTVQQTVGSTNTCIYPSAAGACAAPTASKLITGLGARIITAPISGTSVVITLSLELSSASGTAVKGLHLLPDVSFTTTKGSTLWSAQIAYSSASAWL